VVRFKNKIDQFESFSISKSFNITRNTSYSILTRKIMLDFIKENNILSKEITLFILSKHFITIKDTKNTDIFNKATKYFNKVIERDIWENINKNYIKKINKKRL